MQKISNKVLQMVMVHGDLGETVVCIYSKYFLIVCWYQMKYISDLSLLIFMSRIMTIAQVNSPYEGIWERDI